MSGTLDLAEGHLPGPPHANDQMIGLELQGYVITGVVSAGGMGLVYEGRHSLIGRRAAVKVLRPELCQQVEVADRFLREARALSAIQHRNVVEILNFGALPDGAPYMMMEFLEGETLAQIISRDAPMKAQQALQICREVLSGLGAAHQVGVVHRDLKPANIVLMKQSSGELIVKVLDFGLAKQTDAAVGVALPDAPDAAGDARMSLLAGTPEYINPEQASGTRVGAQGDLYSLGVILFEMLSGKLPFNSTSPFELLQLHRNTAPPRLSAMCAAVDAELEAFVEQLLSKQVEARPSSARAAQDTVERLEHRLASDTVRVQREHRVPRLGGWHWVPRIVVLTGALGLVGMGLTDAAVPHELPDSVSAPAPIVITGRLALASVAQSPAVTLPVRSAPPSTAPCANAAWSRRVRDQIDSLEKLTVARLPIDSTPAEVARIKQKARGLTLSANGARGDDCALVERQLQSWQLATRSPTAPRRGRQ